MKRAEYSSKTLPVVFYDADNARQRRRLAGVGIVEQAVRRHRPESSLAAPHAGFCALCANWMIMSENVEGAVHH